MRVNRRSFIKAAIGLLLPTLAVVPVATKPTQPRLTELYISPEALEDIRNWEVRQIDEMTKKQIFLHGWEA